MTNGRFRGGGFRAGGCSNWIRWLCNLINEERSEFSTRAKGERGYRNNVFVFAGVLLVALVLPWVALFSELTCGDGGSGVSGR